MNRLIKLPAALAATLAVAACGSTTATPSPGGQPAGGEPSPTPSAVASGPEASITLVAREFAFEPMAIQVPSRAHVVLTFVNRGGTAHSFTPSNGVAVSVEAEAGQTQTLSFHVPNSATISFHCKYHPDRMQGTLTVGTVPAGGTGGSAPALPPAAPPTSGGY